jgi:hypothetical protein
VLILLLDLYAVDIGSVADFSEVHADFDIRVEVSRMGEHSYIYIYIYICPTDPWGEGSGTHSGPIGTMDREIFSNGSLQGDQVCQSTISGWCFQVVTCPAMDQATQKVIEGSVLGKSRLQREWEGTKVGNAVL